MPELIKHIDAIARVRERDVLMIAPDRSDLATEVQKLWRRSCERQELIDWLDANFIDWEPSGWPPRNSCMESYQGGIYIDLPYAPFEPLCIKLGDYVKEDAQGILKWPGMRLYLCSLEWAQQFAHHDKPEYWAEQAEDI